MEYIIYKTSRCYYGGEGRRNKRYPTIRAAAKAALDDGNPIGFDVYPYVESHRIRQNGSEICIPVMPWLAIKEFENDLCNG